MANWTFEIGRLKWNRSNRKLKNINTISSLKSNGSIWSNSPRFKSFNVWTEEISYYLSQNQGLTYLCGSNIRWVPFILIIFPFSFRNLCFTPKELLQFSFQSEFCCGDERVSTQHINSCLLLYVVRCLHRFGSLFALDLSNFYVKRLSLNYANETNVGLCVFQRIA